MHELLKVISLSSTLFQRFVSTFANSVDQVLWIKVRKRRSIVFSRGDQVSSSLLSLFTSSAPRNITKVPRATRVPRIFFVSLPLPICRHTHEPSQPVSLVVCSLSLFSTVSRLPREHGDLSRFLSLSSDRREIIEKGESVHTEARYGYLMRTVRGLR